MYLAASLGSLCGAGKGSPTTSLELIGLFGSKSAKEFFAPANIDAVRATLECGSLLAPVLNDNHESYVSFDEDEKTRHRVTILHFKMSDLPSGQGFSRQRSAWGAGLCM